MAYLWLETDHRCRNRLTMYMPSSDEVAAEAWERMTDGGVGYPVFSHYPKFSFVDLCPGGNQYRSFSLRGITIQYHAAC